MTEVVVPRCEGDSFRAMYKPEQCHNGFCWCVTPDGIPVESTLTKGNIKCDKDGKLSIEYSHLVVP